MMKRSVLLAVLISLVPISGLAQTPPLPPLAKLHFKIIDQPGEQFTLPTAINNRGDIGGFVDDFTGATHGYVTDHDNDNVTLIDFPGATATFVNGINDRKDAVGLYIDSAGVVHGFLLKDGSISTLDFPNSIFNSATGINERGQIAGFFQNPDLGVHGYLLDDGKFTIIDDPNSFVGNNNGVPITFTEVLSINERGDVVGFSNDMFGLPRSFLLSDGGFHRIDVPAAAGGTIAFGLNDIDQVTGQFTDVNNSTHGFLFSHSDFRTVDVPGALITQPMQINSSGRIVGTYIDSTGTFHSFLAAPQDDDSYPGDAAGIASPQPAAQNEAPLKTNVPAKPCPVRQPGSPNQTTGMLSCNSQP